MARLRATPRPRDFQHPHDPIRLLAQAAQPKLRKELQEAFRHLRTIVPVPSLAGAIRRGTPQQAAAALIEHWAEVLKGVFNRLGDIRFEAADLGARKITADFKRAGRRVRYVRKAIGDGFDFDRFDEDTLDALRQAQDDLIAELSDQARDTVAYLIDRGVQAGDSAEEIAADIRDTISLTERQAQAVANYRSLLENLDHQALERELRNAEFDDAVAAAIDAGEPLTDSAIDDLVADYADNYLDYRADMIAKTESLRAANEGLRDGYRQAADRGVFPAEAVTRNWLAAIDERTCFPAGVLVSTPHGERPIESLKAGDLVLTRKGQRKLIAIASRRTSRPIIVMRATSGRLLPMTCDHLVFANGAWVEAQDLKVGDRLQSIDDKRIDVLRVGKVSVGNPYCGPSHFQERSITSRILDWVVPKRTIYLYGNFRGWDREVCRVSTEGEFWFKIYADRHQRKSHTQFWKRFAIKGSIASEAAKLAAGIARQCTKFGRTIPAFDDNRGAPASFRAMWPLSSLLPGENLSASFAGRVDSSGSSASARAHGVPVGIAPRNAERLSALFTCLFDARRARGIASERTKLASSLESTQRHHELLSAVCAETGYRHDDDLRFCSEMARKPSVVVYDIQVDDAPEFFANGVLVHNCPICMSIVENNKDGVGLNDDFESDDGPVDDPPVHPSCRCTVEYVTNLDMLPEEDVTEEEQAA